MLENTFISINNDLIKKDQLAYINLYYVVKFKILGGLKILGLLLYTTYSFYFLLSGLILLVAMIGAIILTLNKREGIKHQNDFEQLNRDFHGAVFLKTIQYKKENKI